VSLPVPDRRIRVIVNTDAKNEADDQYAIVHALLTPLFDLRGIIPAHFGTRRTTDSLQESRDEVDLILRLMGLEGTVTVADGAPHAIPDETSPVGSDGARLIVDEAMTDEGTLYVAFLGPLTDMADAILLAPHIVERDVVVVWIGGPPYDETAPAYWPEFNLSNDVHAANVVFGSGMEIWQVPMPVYTQMSVGYAELAEKVAPCGAIGRYLVEQLIEHNTKRHPVPLESRSLGDTPAIGLMMSPTSGRFRLRTPVRFTAEGGHVPATSARSPASGGRPVRVYESVDARFFLEDLFAKLRRFANR
jgi:purine nucleosidase